MDKKSFYERGIRTKYITPAVVSASWNLQSQIREEVCFTDGQIQVRGKTVIDHPRVNDFKSFGGAMTKLKHSLIPLPTNEQACIVTKVYQLMAICDGLESKLSQSQANGEKLMEVMVYNILKETKTASLGAA